MRFVKLFLAAILAVCIWTGTAWADWLAVMDATADNRLAKYAKFETQAEAQAHVDKFVGTYPDAFVTERPAAPFSAWKMDMLNETVSIDVPIEPITKVIENEATRRIDLEVGDDRQQRKTLARVSRLNTKAAIKGQALTVDEQAEIDRMIAVDDYIQAVRDKAAEAVAVLDTLTEQEKLNFDPAVDVAWPAAP